MSPLNVMPNGVGSWPDARDEASAVCGVWMSRATKGPPANGVLGLFGSSDFGWPVSDLRFFLPVEFHRLCFFCFPLFRRPVSAVARAWPLLFLGRRWMCSVLSFLCALLGFSL
ncbi:hypothetical protein I3843_08G146100 [Carya illinoinensis]|nr:hypothetical protein I3843_08G146100 [Carya illinoinensis]